MSHSLSFHRSRLVLGGPSSIINNKAIMYIPNLNDKRVKQKFKDAFAFTKACLNGRTPRRWAKVALDKHYGQSQLPLSRLLRRTMLICTSDAYRFGANGFAKEYIQNSAGASLVRAVLKGSITSGAEFVELVQQLPQTFIEAVRDNEAEFIDDVVDANDTQEDLIYDEEVVYQWAQREYKNEILAGDFKYNTKSHRQWNSIQNIKTSIRSKLFAECGYANDYDMRACAPTLIMQHAQQNGHEEYCFGISDYINNKDEYRAYVSDLLNLNKKKTKIFINSLFCGARIGANKHFILYGFIFDYDKSKVEIAKNDPKLKALREDISTCWQHIAGSMMRVVSNGKRKPISSKQKWNRYFELEAKVMACVSEYAKMTNNSIFLEHDGFRSKNPVNLNELHQFIFDKTNFNVVFE